MEKIGTMFCVVCAHANAARGGEVMGFDGGQCNVRRNVMTLWHLVQTDRGRDRQTGRQTGRLVTDR